MAELTIGAASSLLGRTPSVLEALLAGLGAEWIEADEGPETFSPFEVVGHLIHGERTDWMVRLKLILDQGPEVTFEPFDRFAQREASRGRSIAELLATFKRLRRGNLDDLASLGLTPADLERSGLHPALGRVTVGELLAAWVVHDQSHLAQISRVLAKQYRSAVGPWRQYLPILER